MASLDESTDDIIDLLGTIISQLKSLTKTALAQPKNARLVMECAKIIISLRKTEPEDDFKGMTEKALADRAAQLTAKLAAKKVD